MVIGLIALAVEHWEISLSVLAGLVILTTIVVRRSTKRLEAAKAAAAQADFVARNKAKLEAAQQTMEEETPGSTYIAPYGNPRDWTAL